MAIATRIEAATVLPRQVAPLTLVVQMLVPPALMLVPMLVAVVVKT